MISQFQAFEHSAKSPCTCHARHVLCRKWAILRTHTSPIQIVICWIRKIHRFVLLRLVACTAWDSDATHSPMFHQCEVCGWKRALLCRFESVSTDLFVIFLNAMICKSVFVRHFSQFTEPSAEIDIMGDNGKWLEVGGCVLSTLTY